MTNKANHVRVDLKSSVDKQRTAVQWAIRIALSSLRYFGYTRWPSDVKTKLEGKTFLVEKKSMAVIAFAMSWRICLDEKVYGAVKSPADIRC
ncbi:MAG: hypothetical protein ACWGMZ_11040 [Thermoguttaceae bacterium]